MKRLNDERTSFAIHLSSAFIWVHPRSSAAPPLLNVFVVHSFPADFSDTHKRRDQSHGQAENAELPDDACRMSRTDGEFSDGWRRHPVRRSTASRNPPLRPPATGGAAPVQPIRTEQGFPKCRHGRVRCPHNPSVRIVGSNPQIRQDSTKST